MKVTATELRANLYKILERVEKGEEVEITRANGSLVIKPKVSEKRARRKKLKLTPRPDFVVGDSDDFIHMDWSVYWKPVL